jgi:eukaryotic-like serine/threonine-protein kinase
VSEPAPTPAPESRMRQILAEVGEQGDFPAAARVIDRLRALLGRESAPAPEVARVILKDPGFASKVLRIVNSAYYRKGGEPISTITRAVIVLGFQAIRDVTTSLVLFEELLRRGRSSPRVREGVVRSLHTGLISQRLSSQVGYPKPEEAYLLGLFSDWGMLWLEAFYPADYDRACAVAEERGVPLEDGIVEVLGGGPEALSAAILERWSFPETFAAHFRVRPAADRAALANPATKLSAIVRFAADYAHAVEMDAEEADRIAARGASLFSLAKEQFLHVTDNAAEAVRLQATALGLPPPHRALPRPAQPVAEDAPAAAPPPAAPPAARMTRPPPQDAPSLSAFELIGEITRSIVEQQDINTVLFMILEGIAQVGSFDAVFLALLRPARDRIVGRLGYGEGIEEYLSALSVPLVAGAGVLAETVLDHTPHVVPEGSPAMLVPTGTRAPHIPAATFVACPLAVRGRTVGVLVASRAAGPPVTEVDLATVQVFCHQASMAFAQHAQ